MRNRIIVNSLAALVVATATFAHQHDTTSTQAPLSPPAKAEAKLNGKTITIDYSAPSRRGRVIMGGLLPWGKVWRTGANAATTLRTAADIEIGTLVVPAGTYTLYTIPTEKEWTLIVNRQTGQSGSLYDEKQDLGRVAMNVRRTDSTLERFVITIEPVGNKAILSLKWENVEASVPVSVHR